MESTDASMNVGDGADTNVLFEPSIYRPEQPVFEQGETHMLDDEDDRRSVSTHLGGQSSIVTNYKSDLDPSLFQANKM